MSNSHLKRCLTSLLMREMQIKTTKMYHLTLVRMTAIKQSTNNKGLRGYGEKRTLLHCWKAHKLVLPLWRIAWRFHQELKIELSHEPAIPILGIYPEKNIVQKVTCIPVCIPALSQRPRHEKNLNIHQQIKMW